MVKYEEYRLEDYLIKIGKENLSGNFENISNMINELDFIRINLIKGEVDKINNEYEENKKKSKSTLNKGLVFYASMKFIPSLEFNLYFKTFMIVLRQIIEEYQSLLCQLLFILKKDNLSGDIPKKFSRFIKAIERGDLDFLENKLFKILKENSLELFKIRYLRNKLKKLNNGKYAVWFEDGKHVIKMKYILSKEEIQDSLLQFYLEKGIVRNDIKFLSFDLENILKFYYDFSKLFYNTIVEVLYDKIEL